MTKYKFFCVFLLFSPILVGSTEDGASSLTPNEEPTVPTTTAPTTTSEAPSIMSRIASWINPFSSTTQELDSQESYQGRGQYLPPPTRLQAFPNDQAHTNLNCDQCNSVPWIPIAGTKNVVPIKQSFNHPPTKLQLLHSDLKPPPLVGPQFQHSRHPPRALYTQPYATTTHLRPVTYNAPLGMLPPPVNGGRYHSLPNYPPVLTPTVPSRQYLPIPRPSNSYGAPISNDNFPVLPPHPLNQHHQQGQQQQLSVPVPSNSYGEPLTGINAHYPLRNEYLPPLGLNGPIPVPNLSPYPVLPIHEANEFGTGTVSSHQHQNQPNLESFDQNIGTQNIGTNNGGANEEVQVVPSVNVGDFLASVEHPINVIQSPIFEVLSKESIKDSQPSGTDVKPGGFYGNRNYLSDNPIVVEDTHTAASSYNETTDFDHKKNGGGTRITKEISDSLTENFTPPHIEYTSWLPNVAVPSSSIQPPPPPFSPDQLKQIQIIVPYIKADGYSTLNPDYQSPPTTEDSIWSRFVQQLGFGGQNIESTTSTTESPPSSTTQVENIRDLLKDSQPKGSIKKDNRLPFDVISLQKNIDDWTHQEFSNQLDFEVKSGSKFVPSKNIPQEYFTTAPTQHETIPNIDVDGVGDVDNELLEHTESSAAPEISTLTVQESNTDVFLDKNEKIYIVTPQTPASWSEAPKIGKNLRPSKYLIRVDDSGKDKLGKIKANKNGGLTVVFSEWPHLINNLETTTIKSAATKKVEGTSNHPLFGLMGAPLYTPPPNSTVQTISGHSKVVTVVTQPSVSGTATEKSRGVLVNSEGVNIVTPVPALPAA